MTPHRQCGERERIAVRRDRAIALRLEGKSQKQIAAELGAGETTIRRDLTREMAKLAKRTTDNAEQLRIVELERLDMGIASIADKVKAGDPRALDLWLRYSESRRRLLGLDMQNAPAAPGGGAGITINVVALPAPADDSEAETVDGTVVEPVPQKSAEALPAPDMVEAVV